MLTTNTWNDKLAAARVDFLSRGMLDGTCLSETLRALAASEDDADETTPRSDEDSDGMDLDADDNGIDNREDDTCGPVDGPPILGEVMLAVKKGTSK